MRYLPNTGAGAGVAAHVPPVSRSSMEVPVAVNRKCVKNGDRSESVEPKSDSAMIFLMGEGGQPVNQAIPSNLNHEFGHLHHGTLCDIVLLHIIARATCDVSC